MARPIKPLAATPDSSDGNKREDAGRIEERAAFPTRALMGSIASMMSETSLV
jgi:hypothetical protein